MSEIKTESKFETMMKKCFKPGNLECVVFCVIIALITAILLMTLGFWKTLLIMALVVVALFVGGVSDKKAAFKKAADKVAPVKDKVYRMTSPKVEEAVEEVKEAEAEAEEAVEEVQEEIAETVEEIKEAVEEVTQE